MQYILGVNEFWHDCAAAIFRGSELLAAVEEERLSRVKHHPGFAFAGSGPERAIQWCLDSQGLHDSDIGAVAVSIDMTVERLAGSLFDAILDGCRMTPLRSLVGELNQYRAVTSPRRHLLGATRGYFLDRRRFLAELRRRFGRLFFIDHHLAHARSTYWLSGFDEANIIVMDGCGEKYSTSLYRARGDEITPIGARYAHSQSLGLLYQNLTYLLGFGPFDAGKTMGLAGWGRCRPELGRYLTSNDHGYSIRLSEVKKLWRHARRAEIEDTHRDIAATLQRKLEEAAIALVRFLQGQTGCRKLCLAGGVALNCLMNSAIRESGLVDDLFVQPAAMDMGSAIGAALEVARRSNLPRPARMEHLFYGPAFDSDADIRPALEAWPGAAPPPTTSLTCPIAYTRSANIAADAAKLIAQGEIIGWFHGRAELGPRALGHRSILASPCSIEIRDEVNRRKGREAWRPLAPSVLEERAGDWFANPCPSPFMVLSFRVLDRQRHRVRGIVHADGTARVHTVRRQVDPRFYELIAEHERLTGVPMVLDTSFNLRGEPIVNTPAEALDTARRMQLRYLVLEDFLVELPR